MDTDRTTSMHEPRDFALDKRLIAQTPRGLGRWRVNAACILVSVALLGIARAITRCAAQR